MLKRWKEYFKKPINEKNDRESRTEEAEVINEERRSEECIEKDKKR